MVKLKIALINNLYPPYIIGGNEMLARDVVDELRRRGHEVHVLTGHGKLFAGDPQFHPALNLDLDRKEESFLGGKKPTAFDLFNRHLFNYHSYRAVKKTLKSIKPDLVIGWNLYMASMAPLVASRLLGIPTVIHVCDKWLLFSLRDLKPLINPQTDWQKNVLKIIQNTIQQGLFYLVDTKHIVSISEFMKRKYVEAGFSSAAITPIHLGVPTNEFEIRTRSSTDSREIKLLCIGQLWEGKGPQVALKALAHLINEKGITGLSMVFCGDGTDGFKKYLQEIVAQESIQEHVVFKGFVDRATVKELLNSCDVLVFSSIWDEPFAAVPVEAMSCGMAIVATTAGGTPEAIEHEKTGLLVEPNSYLDMSAALERLIRDPELRSRLGREAAAVARLRFDFCAYVDTLESYYRTIIQQANRNRH